MFVLSTTADAEATELFVRCRSQVGCECASGDDVIKSKQQYSTRINTSLK